MKTVAIIIISCCLTLSAIGIGLYNHIFLAAMVAGQHNHPATPLLYEDFENPTGYDLAGWGELISGTGVVNEDYTATVLYGTQSLFVENDPADNPTYTTNSFAANGHVWVSFKFMVDGAPSLTVQVMELWDVNNTCLSRVTLSDEMQMSVDVLCGGTPVGFGSVLTTNTIYTFWMEHNKDNGANSYASIAVSTGSIRPTSGGFFAEDTGVSSVVDVSRIMFGQTVAPSNPNIGIIYDHLLVDDEQIGDWP